MHSMIQRKVGSHGSIYKVKITAVTLFLTDRPKVANTLHGQKNLLRTRNHCLEKKKNYSQEG